MKSKQQKLTATNLLQYLRSHDLSYMDAICLLDSAKDRLQAIINYELNHLFIADGINDDFKFDDLLLRSREAIHMSKLQREA